MKRVLAVVLAGLVVTGAAAWYATSGARRVSDAAGREPAGTGEGKDALVGGAPGPQVAPAAIRAPRPPEPRDPAEEPLAAESEGDDWDGDLLEESPERERTLPPLSPEVRAFQTQRVRTASRSALDAALALRRAPTRRQQVEARIALVQNVHAAADTAPAEVRTALVELLELGKGNPEDNVEAWEAAESRLREALHNLDELIAIQQAHEATGDVPFR